MKLLLGLLAGMAMLLASCSTAELYYQPLTERPSIPWKGTSSRWGGYTESAAAKNQITIRYQAYNKPTAEAAGYFAVIRAAERSLIDGKNSFYITRQLTLNSRAENSYFRAYTIPGYWETESYRHCDTCPRTGNDINCHYDYERIWYPPEYVPARNVMNYIHTAELRIAYSGKSNQRQDAQLILHEALSNKSGLGKPKLDPRAIAKLTQKKATTSTASP